VRTVFGRMRYWMESARRREALREEMEPTLRRRAELEAEGMTAEPTPGLKARRRRANVGRSWKSTGDLMTRFLSELAMISAMAVAPDANKAFSVWRSCR